MNNLYIKLLKKELGEENYKYLAAKAGEIAEMDDNGFETCISNEIVMMMCADRALDIAARKLRLHKCFAKVVGVSRGFHPTVAVYIIAIILLIAFNVNPFVSIPATILMTMILGYKITQYVSNRWAILDVRIITAYKRALDCLEAASKLTKA